MGDALDNEINKLIQNMVDLIDEYVEKIDAYKF